MLCGWIFSFMTMMMMDDDDFMFRTMDACTLGKIFMEGAERCSKRIRGWLCGMFYRMLQDWYWFVLCDRRFTQLEVFRRNITLFGYMLDICSVRV